MSLEHSFGPWPQWLVPSGCPLLPEINQSPRPPIAFTISMGQIGPPPAAAAFGVVRSAHMLLVSTTTPTHRTLLLHPRTTTWIKLHAAGAVDLQTDVLQQSSKEHLALRLPNYAAATAAFAQRLICKFQSTLLTTKRPCAHPSDCSRPNRSPSVPRCPVSGYSYRSFWWCCCAYTLEVSGTHSFSKG